MEISQSLDDNEPWHCTASVINYTRVSYVDVLLLVSVLLEFHNEASKETLLDVVNNVFKKGLDEVAHNTLLLKVPNKRSG